MLGHPDRLTATFNVHFGHNYNHVSRCTMYGFMNRHFGMGFEEPVLERDFAPLSIAEMSVWNDEHPKPSGDAVGPAHERAVRKWMTADADIQLAKIISADCVDLDALRRTVGTAWQSMIGRAMPTATDVDVEVLDKNDKGRYVQLTTLVHNRPAREELPAVFLFPHNWNGEVVLWVSPEGKSSLYDSANQPVAPVRKLLDAGRGVVAADLYGQGEFTLDGMPIIENRMLVMFDPKQAEGRYAPFTYGYNPTLFAQRVHDVLTLISSIRNHNRKPKRLSVVGLSGAGQWIAAARAIAGPAIDRSAINTNGFRFGEITEQRHANFVPGALKYGDLPVLLALAAPQPLWLAGETVDSAALVRAAYRGAGAGDNLIIPGQASGHDAVAVVNWLIQ